ncbi:hypothetical protein [Lacrimispora sp.]|uniref:hypothetical protein n=1 Tax=Lacrimispora sp. TaxID=2719234 RepID=UPI0029E5231B|nr:hypothetical protein [Lacrimispora sp.]
MSQMNMFEQMVADMEAEVKVFYHKKHGINEPEQITLQGPDACLFSAACVIIKAVAKKHQPEMRRTLLELINDTVLDEMESEGDL